MAAGAWLAVGKGAVLAHDPGGGEPTPEISGVKAELLARWRAGMVPQPVAPIRARDSRADSPASLQQERHWFRRDRDTNTTSRNIAFAAVVNSVLDGDELAAGVDVLGERHEILRTTLYQEAGEVRQRIHPQSMVQVQCADLRGDASPLETAVAAVGGLLGDGFDLARGPLARTRLYRLADARYLLAIVCNHVVADGWSLGVALRELDEIYRARIQRRAPALPPLAIQYRDYAQWQREWLGGEEARAHARYWEAILLDWPGKQLTPDGPAAVSAGADPGGTIPVAVDADLTAAVRAFARLRQTTPFVVLLASHAAALRERVDHGDVMVAIAVARRQQPQVHPLIGFFAGAICIRVRVGDDPTFAELTRRVHADCMSGIAHEELDLTGYLRLCEPARDEDTDPIACSGFFFQPTFPAFTLAGAVLEPVEVRRGHAPAEPELALRDNGATITGSLDYATRVLSHASAGALAAEFLRVLRAGVRQPEKPLSQL